MLLYFITLIKTYGLCVFFLPFFQLGVSHTFDEGFFNLQVYLSIIVHVSITWSPVEGFSVWDWRGISLGDEIFVRCVSLPQFDVRIIPKSGGSCYHTDFRFVGGFVPL